MANGNLWSSTFTNCRDSYGSTAVVRVVVRAVRVRSTWSLGESRLTDRPPNRPVQPGLRRQRSGDQGFEGGVGLLDLELKFVLAVLEEVEMLLQVPHRLLARQHVFLG